MSKKVIYAYIHSDERRLVVDHLNEKHGWEPIFFHGLEAMRPWVEKNYPKAVFHDTIAMRTSRFDYSRIGKQVPIDAEIIHALSKYELNFLNWLQIQDTTGSNYTFPQRRRYYY